MDKFIIGGCLGVAVIVLMLAPFYSGYQYLRDKYLLWKRRSNDEKMQQQRCGSTGRSQCDDVVIDGEKIYRQKKKTRQN